MIIIWVFFEIHLMPGAKVGERGRKAAKVGESRRKVAKGGERWRKAAKGGERFRLNGEYSPIKEFSRD